MIIYADNSGPVKWPKSDRHDPDDEKIYQISYYPGTRQDSKWYTQDIDVIVPSTTNGCMYECISGGISSAIAPTLPTVEKGTYEDGDVTWKCLPLNTLLRPGDTITVSVWTGDTDVTLTSDGITDSIQTEVKVTTVPAGVTSFTITNEIDILRASGNTEKRQKSLVIRIKEL